MSALIAVLLVAATTLAQENTGKILGTVTDATGAVVPGAKLTATSPTLPSPLEATSDSSGRYRFEAAPIGTYTITVSKEGFATLKQFNTVVKLGSQVDYNPKLAVGQITQIVEVAEASVSLDTTSSAAATNITAQVFDNLPKSRTFNSLLPMAPGVRLEVKNGNAGVGGYQVDGASGSENSFVIDGVDVSDIRRGSLRLQNAIPFEFVHEIEIKSSGFEAQYGGAAGGVINVATRGGTNDFHGEILGQFTSNQLNPRPRGWYQRSVANANVAEFFAPKEDNYRTFYPGGRFGGPLVRDKVFFNVGYLPIFSRTERYPQYATGTRTFNREEINHFALARLDVAPNSKLQVNTSWIWSPWRQKGNLPNVDPRIAAPSNDLTVQGGWQPANAYTASSTYAPNGRIVLSARYGYKYQNDKLGNYGLSGAPYVIYQTAAPAGVPLPGGTGFTNVSSTFGVVKDITTRHNLYLSGVYLTSIAGQQHTFKVGYDLARIGNDVNDDYANGRFDIYWGDSFNRGSVTNARGQFGYYRWEDGVRHNAAVNSRNQGFYIQDAWKIHRRVTLNLGVRFENEFLPPYTKEVGGVKIANPVAFGWGDKLAPRLGGAWDLFGDGRWKLSGSFGFYYDVMKYELARGSFGGDYWFSHVYRLDNPNVLSLGKANPGALGTKIISFDNRTIPINARGELEGIDPNIKPFKERRYHISLDRSLSSRLTAGVRYTRTDVLAGIEDIGVLDAEDNEVYLIGNPGLGETRNTKSDYGKKTPNGKEFLVPKATRQYDAVEFRVQGQAKGIQFLTSYTWSRLYGNWSGLANSDESGRSDPGVSRAFDLPYYYFDASGSQKNVFGRLATDRPHEFKLFTSYDLKTHAGTTTFGLSQFAFSGSLDSTSVIYLSAPTFPNGRGDMGRTPVYTQTDFGIYHTFKVSDRTNLRLEANATNLFNQAAVVSRTTQINRAGAITDARLPLNKFFSGYKLSDFVYPGNFTVSGLPQYNPIYNLPGGNYRAGGGGAYQSPREIRLGIRLMF
ncbi:MAG: TonB-dependent receptor [Acidobacteria bacterium]|nr:TonB-dependent receptor [Acidobacteriota bacterium]